MSDDHSNIQDVICKILEWYGFYSKDEYTVDGGLIDCVASNHKSQKPFIGIEVHLSGSLDTDLKKLLGFSSLKYKVIVTRDRQLIIRMSKEMPAISWFQVPSQEEHSLEDYIRSLPGALKRDKYWFEGSMYIKTIENGDASVRKFEDMLRDNGLDTDLAEKIIYRFASSAGGLPQDHGYYADTNEYKFLRSLGIAQGLEIYWFDMEWEDKVRYSYQRAEVQGITSTREMEGQPIAYMEKKNIIVGVMRSHLEKIKITSGGELGDNGRLFALVALVGTRGFLRPYRNNFISEYETLPGWMPPREGARLGALAANPFISSKIWEFANELDNKGIGVKQSDNLITAPYKLIADVFELSGRITGMEAEINEYLSWWVLYRGALMGKNIAMQCDLLGIQFEDVLKCVDETFSRKLTSRYLNDTGRIREINDFSASHGGNEIEGVSDISVFNKEGFEDFCKMKIQEALSDLF